MTIVNPLLLMMRYLHGKSELSNDEREILLFALYTENSKTKDGIVSRAIRELKRADTPIAVAAATPLNADEIVEACAKYVEALASDDGLIQDPDLFEVGEHLRELKGRFSLAAPQVREGTKG